MKLFIEYTPSWPILHFQEALMSKKLASKEPTDIPEAAVQHVLYEIEEAMSVSNSFDTDISNIEKYADPTSSCDMDPTSSLAYLTSPMPARKNKSKSSKQDHSNKGGVGSHKINHQKLQLSVKANSFYD